MDEHKNDKKKKATLRDVEFWGQLYFHSGATFQFGLNCLVGRGVAGAFRSQSSMAPKPVVSVQI